MDITLVMKLCEALDGHVERYQTLVDYVAEERKCLMDLDLDRLFVSSQNKERLAKDIQENIKDLVEGINETALMLGLPLDPQPLLTDLVPLVPRPFDNRLNDGSMKLERLKNTILRENEANRNFIEEAVRMVNESINILTGADKLKGDGYTNDGRQGEKKLTLPVKLSKEV